MDGLWLARACDVVVDRLLDALACTYAQDVLMQQVPIEGIGMVEVDELPTIFWHIATILIVGVEWQQHHLTLWQTLYDFSYDGGLP